MPNFQLKPKELSQVQSEPDRWNFAPTESETKIIAFSGKIGSGKTSASNFLHSLAFMFVLNLTREAYVNEAGKLVVLSDENEYREVSLDNKDTEVVQYLSQSVWPFIKKYSCADPLKRIAIDVLGLDEQLVYGSQSDKNTLTHLKWEDMPTRSVDPVKKNKKSQLAEQIDGPEIKSGYMTVRDVLEYVGTELFRKMYNDCWANALVKTIQRERPAFAVIDDVRFINEVNAIQRAGGKVIRFTLMTDEAASNTHTSNVALDKFTGFDVVLDNQNLSMSETFAELLKVLTEWEYFKVVN